MRKIGLFGGTFDPIHFGHLQLAIALFEIHKLDEVWWIPAKCNPLKAKQPLADFHREEMLKLALLEIPQFKVLDIELKRDLPSFTVDTLMSLSQSFKDCEFYLLLGDDVLSHFMEWKNPLEVIRLAKPLVGGRLNSHFAGVQGGVNEIKEAFEEGWTKIPLLDISATDIRKRLSNKLFCGHLVPAKVLDYILVNQLYS